MTEKIVISAGEFNKRVEIEYSYLTYMDRLKKDEALKVAHEYVSEKYEVKEKQ